MEYKEQFEDALRSPDPIDALRRFARELAKSGLTRDAVYNAFFTFYKTLQSDGREMDEGRLGDVMDMIVGAYPPYNLDLPRI